MRYFPEAVLEQQADRGRVLPEIQEAERLALEAWGTLLAVSIKHRGVEAVREALVRTPPEAR